MAAWTGAFEFPDFWDKYMRSLLNTFLSSHPSPPVVSITVLNQKVI